MVAGVAAISLSETSAEGRHDSLGATLGLWRGTSSGLGGGGVLVSGPPKKKKYNDSSGFWVHSAQTHPFLDHWPLLDSMEKNTTQVESHETSIESLAEMLLTSVG